MNRDLIFINMIMNNSRNEVEQLPAWARAERLLYFEIPSKRNATNTHQQVHFTFVKRNIADSLRKLANKLDPLQVPTNKVRV